MLNHKQGIIKARSIVLDAIVLPLVVCVVTEVHIRPFKGSVEKGCNNVYYIF